MRILFFSCNGFSLDVKLEDFVGPALWNDVSRGTCPALDQERIPIPRPIVHSQRPFHVMIGGCDQVCVSLINFGQQHLTATSFYAYATDIL